MQVYQAEIDLGLADKVNASKVCYAALLSEAPKFQISRAILDKLDLVKAGIQPDLFYLQTLLVSAGWNLNTDVFDAVELWEARHTPEDKPINYQHDGNDIVGHMTANFCVDDDLKVLASETSPDKLPSLFHILTNGVLYKLWEDKERQKKVDKLIAEIKKKEWSVSMEVLFSNFDYALQSTEGNKVVARNEKTAFLTKHLRAYGGTGEWEGQKIGRLLRKLTFCGKGLVRNPANPNSKIFETIKEFNVSSAKAVYEIIDTNREIVMAQENDKLVTDLNKQILDLQTQIKEGDTKVLKAEIDTLKSDKVKLSDSLTKETEDKKVVAGKLEKAEKDLVEANKNLGEAQKAFTVAKTELDVIKAERKKDGRIAALVEKKLAKEDAIKLVETLSPLDDAAFASYLETHSKAFKVAEPDKKTDATKVLEGVKEEKTPALTIPETDGIQKVQAEIVNYLAKTPKTDKKGDK